MFDAQTTVSTGSPSKQTEGPTLVLDALRSERDALRSELRSTRLEVDMLRSELRRCEAARDGGTPLALTPLASLTCLLAPLVRTLANPTCNLT